MDSDDRKKGEVVVRTTGEDRPTVTSDAGKHGGAIARRAGLVAAGSLASRALGFIRDMVFAAVFPKEATDLFVVAWTIPNALRVLLGEGAVAAAVVPVFVETRAEEGEEAARRYFSRLTGLMIVVLSVVCILGVLAAPALISVYATGYRGDETRFADAVTLTRLVFPYLFFIGLAALGVGGLNALKRFAVPAFTPALLNVAFVLSAFTFVAPAVAVGLPPIAALAIGGVLGGVLQVVAQWPEQRRMGLLRWPRFEFRDARIIKTLKLMVPLLAGFGVYQLNTILGRNLASFLAEGSQSYLYYGQRVVEIPQGMFALAIGSAALPTLTELRQQGDSEKVKEVFGGALRMTLFLAIPSTLALIVLAEPVITVAFSRGPFGPAEVAQTAPSLLWQATGIWAIASVRTVVPMFFAYHDTKSPIVASAINLVVFGVTALALVGPFAHVGIAMALSAAGFAQLVTLLYLLRRKVGPLGLRAVVQSAVRVLLASLVMALILYPMRGYGHWERGGNDIGNVAWLLLMVAVGGLTFGIAAWLLKSPELRQLVAALSKRLGRR